MWRSKPAEEAIETFKRLLSSIMIRRTKTILDLPNREDRIIRLPFDIDEREHYDRIERPTVDMLDRSARDGSNSGVSWMTAIQQINKLRLVCNLGTFVPSLQSSLIQPGDDDRLSVLAARFSIGGELCVQCLQFIESSPGDTELGISSSPSVYYSSCTQFFCAGCSELLQYKTPQPCGCPKSSTPCTLRPMKPFLRTPRLTPSGDSPLSPKDKEDTSKISSKVRAVISQIKSQRSDKQ